MVTLITKLLKHLFPRCDKCGLRGEYLMQGLCVECWYQEYGKGLNIWEIQDEIGRQVPSFFNWPLRKISQKLKWR